MLENHLHPISFEDINAITSSNLDWNKLSNKTILISGANGFLASYLVYTFLMLNDKHKINCKIIGISRAKQHAENRFKELLKRDDFEIIISDVCDALRLNKKTEIIIHAASQASPKYYGVDPVGTLNANVLGTNNLLQIAKDNNADAFLFFSSSEVYGTVDEDKIPTKENDFGFLDCTNVRSCYAESKRMGETMCISWMHQYKVPVKIVRPFHTYGPGMDLTDGRVYADFISDVVHGRNIQMKSNGSARRAFCYLKDATEGFLYVLLNGKTGEAYNVGNPAGEESIINLAQKIVALFPDKKLSVIKKEERNGEYLKSKVQRNCPDISKIKELGWNPSTTIETGFKRTVESYL